MFRFIKRSFLIQWSNNSNFNFKLPERQKKFKLLYDWLNLVSDWLISNFLEKVER